MLFLQLELLLQALLLRLDGGSVVLVRRHGLHDAAPALGRVSAGSLDDAAPLIVATLAILSVAVLREDAVVDPEAADVHLARLPRLRLCHLLAGGPIVVPAIFAVPSSPSAQGRLLESLLVHGNGGQRVLGRA